LSYQIPREYRGGKGLNKTRSEGKSGKNKRKDYANEPSKVE